MAEFKRDRINRQRPVRDEKYGAVILPISCTLKPGDEITLRNIRERDINCDIRDPNQMYDPHTGNGVGDAVFDAGFGSGWKEFSGEAGSPFVAVNACNAGEGEETFYILAEHGGVISHEGVRYLRET